MEPDTPVLRNDASTHTCPYFYMDPSNVQSLAQAVTSVLHTGIAKAVLATDGRVHIGRTEMTTEYVQGEVPPIDDFRDLSLPLAGDAGIQELVKTGKLRRHYVVLQPMTIPADLYGANSVTFIVPQGVERPKGNLGHSAVHGMNQRLTE